jgi:hypothetical protein
MPLGPILPSRKYCDAIRPHYAECWGVEPEVSQFQKRPISELPSEFRVLVFAPNERRKMWTYATACMSQKHDRLPMELHLFAPHRNDDIVELLVATCHYHRTDEWLGLGHSVNFGRPWWHGSVCDHGLISLPYLDGPILEWMEFGQAKVRFLWLIPVTTSEIELKRAKGLASLERKFERTKFNYLDPKRRSVV